MRISVFEHIGIVILEAKSQVELVVEPYFGRVVVLNDHPYSDVELTLIDNQWVLYIFLHNILRLFA